MANANWRRRPRVIIEPSATGEAVDVHLERRRASLSARRGGATGRSHPSEGRTLISPEKSIQGYDVEPTLCHRHRSSALRRLSNYTCSSISPQGGSGLSMPHDLTIANPAMPLSVDWQKNSFNCALLQNTL